MTLRGIDYSEAGVKPGQTSPTYTFVREGTSTASQILRVGWDDRIEALKQLVGYSYRDAEATYGSTMRRVIPQPLMPDIQMVAKSAQVVAGEKFTGRMKWDEDLYTPIEGYPNNDVNEDVAGDTHLKSNEFKNALIRVDFEHVDFDIWDDEELQLLYASDEKQRFVSFRKDRFVNNVSFPGGVLYYLFDQGGGESTNDWNARRVVPFSVGVNELTETLYLTWRGIPLECYPDDALGSIIGTVNNADFEFGGITYPAGTLLCMPPRETRYVQADGTKAITTELVLNYQPKLHNKLLAVNIAAKTRDYYYVVTDNTITEATEGSLPVNKVIYNESNFDDLFVTI